MMEPPEVRCHLTAEHLNGRSLEEAVAAWHSDHNALA
jgi:hypothetical protein